MTPETDPRTDRAISVQLFYAGDCPFVDGVRALLQRSVASVALPITVDEIEGAFPSPTVLVDGLDVTARRAVGAPSCRLDVPTETQIRDAFDAATVRRGISEGSS